MLTSTRRKDKDLSNAVKLPEKKERSRIANPFKVYVVGGGYDYIRMMLALGYAGAKGLGDADIILFTGGEDVDPALYGEKALKGTNYNTMRDNKESVIYQEALAAKIPMVGICRGGQFLNVMNGGKMWQHVNNHCGNHKMTDVLLSAHRGEEVTLEVTSTHHQMMIPNEETALILATAAMSTSKLSFTSDLSIPKPHGDVEVVWYENTSCLCFQPHPEFRTAPAECVNFFDECMDNYVIPSTFGKVAA